MIKTYKQLTDKEENQLAQAWASIARSLTIYENITGASDLSNVINEKLWEEIEYQKEEEV